MQIKKRQIQFSDYFLCNRQQASMTLFLVINADKPLSGVKIDKKASFCTLTSRTSENI
jgi:hypothetical protein|tara:strand:+ start:1742 stop:1915 length:174 start_codon:yes stop_codon:yes gene_type:complete